MAEDLKDIHRELIERRDEAMSYDLENRNKSVDDVCFADVDDCQWGQLETAKRKNRPRYTVNKIALPLNQVEGDYKQNRLDIKFRAFDGDATAKIAAFKSGLVRSIGSTPRARQSRDSAFRNIIRGGFGAWRVLTEFTHKESFDQRIVIRPLHDPWYSVWRDVYAEDINGRDDMYTIIEREISIRRFKELFKDKSASSMSTHSRGQRSSTSYGWFGKDSVRVAEYWRREFKKRKIHLLSDGRVVKHDEVKSVLDELSDQGIKIVNTREVDFPEVKMYKASGNEILQEASIWAGDSIPIIKVYGYLTHVNNQMYYRGIVRPAKDPSRIYNYATSANVEAIALSPKDPIWMTRKQAKGEEEALKSFNVRNDPFMFYNPDATAPGPPIRGGAPAIQQGLIQQIQQADFDIQATSGRFSPSLGDNPKDQSGRAVLAQQRQGDLGTFSLIDSMISGMEFEGEILNDIIPKIYDTKRQERILKEDGETEIVKINETVIDTQTGSPVIVNDISAGTYDLFVDVVPTSKTQRIESAANLDAWVRAVPEMALPTSDIRAKLIDAPGSEELQKRARMILIKQGLVKPNEEEAAELESEVDPQQIKMQQAQNKMQAQLIDMQFRKMQLELEKTAAEVDKLEILKQKEQASISKIISETQENNVDSGSQPSPVQQLNDRQLAQELLESGSTAPLSGAKQQAPVPQQQ